MQHDHDQILFWRTFSNGRAQICAQYSKLFKFAFEWTNHIVKFEYTVLFIEQGKYGRKWRSLWSLDSISAAFSIESSLGNCRESRVESTKSRVETNMSRVETHSKIYRSAKLIDKNR